MTMRLIDLHLMSANLAGLMGGLQDIHDSDTDNGKNALLPMIQTCHRLSEELNLAIDKLDISHVLVAKAATDETPEQKETPRSERDFDEINRLNSGLSEIAGLCAALDGVNWDLCEQIFESKEQQRIRDSLIALSRVIGEKAVATLNPPKEAA